jgi:molybdopterin synthase catalytic subunit
MISVTRDDFDLNAELDRVRRPDMGGLVTFLGVVRNDGGLEAMELEAYEEVAVKELETIRDEAFSRFPIGAVTVIHRIGRLRVGENILLISSAPGTGKRRSMPASISSNGSSRACRSGRRRSGKTASAGCRASRPEAMHDPAAVLP